MTKDSLDSIDTADVHEQAIYDHIETKVQQYCRETEADPIDRIRCSSVLFVIA